MGGTINKSSLGRGELELLLAVCMLFTIGLLAAINYRHEYLSDRTIITSQVSEVGIEYVKIGKYGENALVIKLSGHERQAFFLNFTDSIERQILADIRSSNEPVTVTVFSMDLASRGSRLPTVPILALRQGDHDLAYAGRPFERLKRFYAISALASLALGLFGVFRIWRS
jgi:hypothetical protein